MANARVVADFECPGCDGHKVYPWKPEMIGTMPQLPCTVCHGTGTVQRVVTCASCRWFDADDESCLLAETHGANADHPDDRMALAMDSEGYHAWLTVPPSFGCVMWEARDAN